MPSDAVQLFRFGVPPKSILKLMRSRQVCGFKISAQHHKKNPGSQNPLAQKHLGVMFCSLPQCRSLSSLISLTNAAPTLRHWLTTLPGRRLFPGPVGICHLEGWDAFQLGVGTAGDSHVWTYDPVIPQIFPM